MNLSRLVRRPLRLAWCVLATAVLTWITWRKWPDLMVDFGHELYFPWRVSQGAVMVRDLDTLYGPLSQTFNGMLFRMFGISFSTLIAANLALLAVLIVAVDDFFAEAVGPFAAWIADTVLIAAFAFAHYSTIGNYNYVAPYSHELTHGVILGTVMVTLLARHLRSEGVLGLAVAGLCLGFAQLTKPEIAAAAMLSAGVFFVLAPRRPHSLIIFLGAACIPLLTTLGLFTRLMPLRDAAAATLHGWVAVTRGAVGGTYYRRGLGIDAPWENLFLLGRAAIIVIGLVGLGPLLDRVTKGWGASRMWIACALAIGLVLLTTDGRTYGNWMDFGRPLPLFMGAGLAWFTVQGLRKRTTPEAAKPIALAAWAAWALGLLAKMVLNAQLPHYGFALAMPATLLTMVFVADLLPRSMGAGALITRVGGLAFVAAFLSIHIGWSMRSYSIDTLSVGQGGDRIVALDPKFAIVSKAIGRAVDDLRRLTPENATVAVFPEGSILNYLARRRSSTRYVNFTATELAGGGEERILEAHRASPPDFVVLVDRDSSDFGVGQFGVDPANGMRIMQWVRANYVPVETMLHEPFTGGPFGIQILKRR